MLPYILIFSFISGSGTISRNQQGSREDLHSAESRDSRISTNANSQSSSVYDNVKVCRLCLIFSIFPVVVCHPGDLMEWWLFVFLIIFHFRSLSVVMSSEVSENAEMFVAADVTDVTDVMVVMVATFVKGETEDDSTGDPVTLTRPALWSWRKTWGVRVWTTVIWTQWGRERRVLRGNNEVNPLINWTTRLRFVGFSCRELPLCGGKVLTDLSNILSLLCG